MRKKRTPEKLDVGISSIYESATENEMVSCIIFAGRHKIDTVREKLKSKGCFIKYELQMLNAFAVNMPIFMAKEIAEDEKIVYIAEDFDASTCMHIAKPTVLNRPVKETGRGVGVAVIDTGIHPHHDLTSNGNRIEAFVDFVNRRNYPYDDNGHGTHVAGIIASDGYDSFGKFQGIAPKCHLVGLKVMDREGRGATSDILAALNWTWKNRERYNIRVVCLSLGSVIKQKRAYDPLIEGCEALVDSNVTVVCAAGNEGPGKSTINTPGVSKKVITVGCSDDKRTISPLDDTVASFSSRGPGIYTKFKPDLVAPGVDIVSLANQNSGYTKMSGTSMSCPIVVGCCALLLEKYPDLSVEEVKHRLLKSTYPLNDIRYSEGRGLIQIEKLLK